VGTFSFLFEDSGSLPSSSPSKEGGGDLKLALAPEISSSNLSKGETEVNGVASVTTLVDPDISLATALRIGPKDSFEGLCSGSFGVASREGGGMGCFAFLNGRTCGSRVLF